MDIRKADSKGRLTGALPGAYYRISGSSNKFEATYVTFLGKNDVYQNTPDGGTPSEKVQNYLWRFGIDPKEVSAEGLTDLGYTAFVLTEDGKRIDEYGISKTERRPWPVGFDWDEYVGLILEGED